MSSMQYEDEGAPRLPCEQHYHDSRPALLFLWLRGSGTRYNRAGRSAEGQGSKGDRQANRKKPAEGLRGSASSRAFSRRKKGRCVLSSVKYASRPQRRQQGVDFGLYSLHLGLRGRV